MAKPNLTTPELTEKQLRRFWGYIAKKDINECWLWTGSTVGRGYGRMSFGRHRTLRSHRVAYLLHYGLWPGELLVCHKCDNPPCCNPHHLFLGTSDDNIKDAVKKGRMISGDQWQAKHPNHVKRGSQNHTSKLTEAQVLEIRERVAKKEMPQYQLQKIYRICQRTMYLIVHRKSWTHI